LSLAGLALVSYWLKTTPSGKQVRASTDNRFGAMLSGVNVDRSWTIGQVVCFGMAGLGGAVLMLFGVVYPARGLDLGVLAFVVAVLGGMGHVWGGAAAGLIVGLIDSVGRIFLPVALVPVVRAVLIILVIAIRPRGLFGLGVMGKH
jgi:branched-chain amino acid transport system permease protein